MGSTEGAKKARKRIRKITGRPKGSRSKFTNLKEAFLKAFENIGGAEGLTVWADKDKNKGEFYRMVTKMLPHEIQGEIKAAIKYLGENPEVKNGD